MVLKNPSSVESLPQCSDVVGWLVQRLEVMETSMERVQSDVRQLTDERDNIRSTFNDLTLKLIHGQVRYHAYCVNVHVHLLICF